MPLRRLALPLLSLPLIGAACAPEPDAAVSDLTEERRVRIVEVFASPVASPAEAFVELRNDGESPVSLNGWSLKFGSSEARLLPRPVADSAEQARGIDPTTVPPHSLALVVDAAMPEEQVARIACESPIQTTQASLGDAHAAQNDILATTLALQAERHCAPVFTIETADGLGKRLASVTDLSLMERKTRRDRARGSWGKQPRGVSLERRGAAPEAFEPSPLGSTPGARNFWRSDAGLLADPSARPPIEALASSPWRVGDTILALRREAATKSGAEAQALLDQANALANGEHLPHNPLIEPFDELVATAKKSAVGAFYQINDPVVVDALVKARKRGNVDVKLVTDAEFEKDPHYVGGLDRLRQAGVPIVFDEAGGANRAPLMHDKFLAVDQRWVWTGSFNPIEDEPHRIHADNVLVLESRALGELHMREHELMMSGKFGTGKRGFGVGGATTWIDGARTDVRFSPGLTADQLKRRGTELAKTGDPRKACEVVVPSNRQKVIEDRYRSLDPCGGPMDLILGEIARATSSIYFVAFSLALEDAADVMIERLGAGVDVKGVVDPTVATKGVPSSILNAGADVRFTPNSDPDCPAYVKPKSNCPKNPNEVWLHHKFVVVDYGTDHPVVITGSHNMSDSAELQNDEALVVIRDRAVAEAYYRFFREVYDHPQTLGQRRDMTGLPTLAITEVRPSPDPSGPQFVEIENLGDEPVSLAGLELWNRRTSVALGNATLAPGARALVTAGSGVSAPESVPVFTAPSDTRPFVSPATALVLREANGGRWIATYDPYTSEQSLPAGVQPGAAGDAWDWSSFDRSALEATLLELLGNDTTPDAPVPTWEPRGFYSDWPHEVDVTPVGIVLMKAPLLPWTPAGQGTPGI